MSLLNKKIYNIQKKPPIKDENIKKKRWKVIYSITLLLMISTLLRG